MARAARFSFGVLAYLLFFVTFVYLIAFVGNLYVPRSIDVGPDAPVALAIVINVALIALFGLQHSVMARPKFKAAWTRTVHVSIERSMYVVAASLALILMYAFWLPIPERIWSVDAGWARVLLWTLFGVGWAIVFVSTWLLNHFALFGIAQVWADFNGRQMAEPQFREPLFYRAVRHPLYAGFLLAFWATPEMSAGHLLFAVAMTIYVLIAIRHEERDLIAHIGPAYEDYRRRVGMLLPGIGKARR